MLLELNVDDGMVDGVSAMVGRFFKIAMTEPDISKSSIHDRLLEIPRHRRLNFLVVVIILCYYATFAGILLQPTNTKYTNLKS